MKRPLNLRALILAFTSILAILGSTAVSHAAPPVKYIRSYGSGNGMPSGPGQLATPEGVAVERKSGNVLVADSMNNRIEEFHANGKFLKSFGSSGSKPGQFAGPQGLAINYSGDIYVADTFNHRVQEFTSKFKFIRQFGTFTSGPNDLAVAPNGTVYAADGSYIRYFTGKGSLIGSFGGTGAGTGQFHSVIAGLAVGPKGNVWAGDYSGGRVEKFTAAGAYLQSVGTRGKATVQGPLGVAVVKSAIYISDNGHERVVQLNPNGAFVKAFGMSGKGKLDNTGPLAVDCRGNIYDSDIDVGRVREYGTPATPNGICSK